MPVDTDTQRALRRTTRALSDAGCTVERRDPPLDVNDGLDTWGRTRGFELNAGMLGPLRSPPLKQLLRHGYVRSQLGFLARPLARGAGLRPRGCFRALDRKETLSRSVDAFLAGGALWLTPAASIPAFTHRATDAELSIEGVPVPYALPFAAYNCATAVTGPPA